MPFVVVAIVFAMLAWAAWHFGVRDANILYAALALVLAAVALFFFFGAFIT